MDAAVRSQLEKEGFDVTLEHRLVRIPIAVGEGDLPQPLGEEVLLLKEGDAPVRVKLKRLSELFVGSRLPPSFAGGPAPGYEQFFATIEMAALDFGECTGRLERDEELARLYNHLRRRPDGSDSNPLFSYLQGAARLYLSLRDVSRAEFEAVAHRLYQSARHFRTDLTSTNLLESLRGTLDSL